MHGIQAWVALPDEAEESDPSFHHLAGADLPTWHEPGLFARLIAGEAEGMRAATPVHSPQFYIHLDMAAGARRIIPAEYSERAVFCASGAIEVDGRAVQAGQMAVLSPGGDVTIAASAPSKVMVLGGEPIGKRYMLWNFVSSRQDRLLQAREDWQQGRFKLPDADDAEFIPFPAGREME